LGAAAFCLQLVHVCLPRAVQQPTRVGGAAVDVGAVCGRKKVGTGRTTLTPTPTVSRSTPRSAPTSTPQRVRLQLVTSAPGRQVTLQDGGVATPTICSL